jgi:hypothetical protein
MYLIFIIWIVDLTFDHIKSIVTVMKRINISNYSYNKIYDEHMVDMLLPLNIIDDFVITRFFNIKRVHYKDPSHLQTYHY